MAKLPTANDSDYKKMGPMGEGSLFVLYTIFSQVFMLPGIVGASVALFGKKSESALARASVVTAASAGPLYLGWHVLKFMCTQIQANLGTARRPTGVNIPDQHVYKAVGGPADGSIVLMDNDKAYGQFNRAQRAWNNLGEALPFMIADLFLAGLVFPWTAGLCAASFGAFRLKGALDYTDERTKRMTGNMVANMFAGSLGGIVLVVGIFSTLSECRKGKA